VHFLDKGEMRREWVYGPAGDLLLSLFLIFFVFFLQSLLFDQFNRCFFFFFCLPFPSWLALELKAPPESMQHTYKYTNAAEKIALHFVNYAL